LRRGLPRAQAICGTTRRRDITTARSGKKANRPGCDVVAQASDDAWAAAGVKPMGSINFRFSGVFLFVLAVVIVLGSFSAWRLSDYRTYSGELRDRFFRSTQYIGDLNNYTSDFRAGEGTAILSLDPTRASENIKELQKLDDLVALAQHSYEHVSHSAHESEIYTRFRSEWAAYRAIAGQVLSLAAAGQRQQATTVYLAASRSAYDAASDTLGELTELNLVDANAATRRADSAYHEASLATILAMVFAGLMVVGGLLHMRRSIADPLVDLARSMRDLASNETDVEIHGAERRDEIGGMARAVVVFRKNAVDLALSQRALADQAAILSEKLAAEQKLTQLQRNFLSMASHEFRTPLTIIDGQAQRLINAKDRLGPDDVAERARKIRGAVLRITSVIDHLIDAARLVDSDAGLYFHPADLDVAEVLREVCRQYRDVVPTAFIWEDFGSAPLFVRGDRRLLFDLFSNLISNGIKYSVDKINLRVRARSTPEHVIVEVEDHGVGIPEKDREHLFERYFRGGNVSGIVGTGVGLYLVKMVTDLHGGEISVESQEGEGSRFTVRLPTRPAAAAPLDAARPEPPAEPLSETPGRRDPRRRSAPGGRPPSRG
jgi:signal transduction histidine kinase